MPKFTNQASRPFMDLSDIVKSDFLNLASIPKDIQCIVKLGQPRSNFTDFLAAAQAEIILGLGPGQYGLDPPRLA